MRAAHFFRQTIVHKPLVTADSYEGSTFGEARAVLGRWTDRDELLRASDGREVVSTARVSTLVALSAGDVLVDAGGRSREVVSVREARDVRGRFTHFVVSVT